MLEKSYLMTVCGVWIALCSSVIGQDSGTKPTPTPATRLNNEQGSYRQPSNGSIPPRPNVGGPAPSNLQPALPQYFQAPYANSADFSVPAEMMIFQEGEFKVVTQNLNDPKIVDAAREGGKILNEAVQTFRSESRSEDKYNEAKKIMTQYLQAHFDHDQKKRRAQLESLEAQVVKLKAQLEKRSQSKEQLIELRLTLLENDASGLSFPQSWTQLPDSNGVYRMDMGYPQNPNLPNSNYPVANPYQSNPPVFSYPPGVSYVPGLPSYTPVPSGGFPSAR